MSCSICTGRTNHHDLRPDPETSAPDRFRATAPGTYDVVPRGGGGHPTGHRCAGEWVTIALMKAAVRFLAREVVYRVPEQDVRVGLRRIPAMPRSGMLLAGIARKDGRGDRSRTGGVRTAR